MDRHYPFSGFDFNNDLAFYEDIDAIAAIQLQPLYIEQVKSSVFQNVYFAPLAHG